MMNKKEIFRKVGGIIAELNDQYEYLSKSPENLNELELELFSANANFLSDHLSVLLKLNTAERKEAASSKPEMVVAETEQSGTASQDADQDSDRSAAKMTFEFDKSEKDDLGGEESSDQEFESTHDIEKESTASEAKSEMKSVEEEQSEPSEEEETKINQSSNGEITQKNDASASESPEPFVKEVVISERTVALPTDSVPKDSKPTMNELFSRKDQTGNFGSQFSQRQTKDLKGMVSLNDKLLFVRDLFNGYSLAYSEAIELLNRFDSLEAAQNFLKQNYSVKNNWDAKSETAQKFYDVLEQRFAK